MKVYCTHGKPFLSKSGKYNTCRQCGFSWYDRDVIPLVVIGTTDPYEASPNYAKQFEEKDLSKKQFVQCHICKDLVEKRKHTWCEYKLWFKKLLLKLRIK